MGKPILPVAPVTSTDHRSGVAMARDHSVWHRERVTGPGEPGRGQSGATRRSVEECGSTRRRRRSRPSGRPRVSLAPRSTRPRATGGSRGWSPWRRSGSSRSRTRCIHSCSSRRLSTASSSSTIPMSATGSARSMKRVRTASWVRGVMLPISASPSAHRSERALSMARPARRYRRISTSSSSGRTARWTSSSSPRAIVLRQRKPTASR